jgi:hypothetical protein
MPRIKCNLSTGEIELKGSESFIGLNFDKIQNLLNEIIGVKKVNVLKKVKTKQRPILVAKMKESQTVVDIKMHVPPEASSILPAGKSSIIEFSVETKAKRPPLKKYIRKEGRPGNQRIVVEVAKQKEHEISIASLREKFGLSESKIGGIIRDAEKLGKLRRSINGSFTWTQD